jgi:predicted cupin superfamily sugar epimerase
MPTAQQWIAALQLSRHPEGGYFRETYRADEVIAAAHLPVRFRSDHAFSTAIYYLLEGEDFSALHRIRQDEVWHHYDGAPLTIHVLDEQGSPWALVLGKSFEQGERPQIVVRAGCWFGAVVSQPHSFTLTGCTVAPGFLFEDFELADRQHLCQLYPQHADLIRRLTR